MRTSWKWSAAVLAVGLVVAGAGPAGAADEGRVVGWVFFDRDGDRGRDADEPPRVGASVTVRGVGSGVERTGVTDGEGRFEVAGLPLGAYDVTASAAGYRSLDASSRRVELADATPVNAWFPQQGGEISGRAWLDADGDGVREGGESAVDTTFTLIGHSDHEGTVLRALPSGGGQYAFHDLPAGTYRVEAAAPAGTRATRPLRGDWRADSNVVGTPLSTPPTRLPVAWWAYDLDAGFAPGSGPLNPGLVNALSGWCLDQEYPQGTATTGVGAYHCNGQANQRWVLRWDSADTAVVVDELSGWCLDQEYPQGTATTAVGAWPCNGGANQRWRMERDHYDDTTTLVNALSGWCLDQEYPQGTVTTGVGAYYCNGQANQRWKFQ
ncbi:RICIN domain-containing protein [Saccharothrix coeruleofusca]|uniref:RICIN domain-containing protein n=1 Tax=Saccharothrix coeruleofusca TaxID=33919 RepID=UPI00166F8B9E|nr:SdrD B-like domain-containing protein [Saccharothrix coeruleofusca]